MSNTLIITKGILNIKAFSITNNPSNTNNCLIEQDNLVNIEIYDNTEYIKNSIFIGIIIHINYVFKSIFVDCGNNNIFIVSFNEINSELYTENKLKKGQRIIIQVIKENLGKKRHKATTFIQIKGFYCTLQVKKILYEVSQKENYVIKLEKKINNKTQKYYFLLNKNITLYKQTSFIYRECKILNKIWTNIQEKFKTDFIGKVYTNSFIHHCVSKYFTKNTKEIIINDNYIIEEIHKITNKIFRGILHKIKFMNNCDIEQKYNLYSQFLKLSQNRTTVQNGPELVIEHTESMTTIDINSSKYKDNKKNKILDINKKCAIEAAKQIILRNIGGLIAIDFIDNINTKDNNEITNILKQMFLHEKTTKISNINTHGVITISRNRNNKNLFEIEYQKENYVITKRNKFILEEIMYLIYKEYILKKMNNVIVFVKRVDILEFIIENYTDIFSFFKIETHIKFKLNTLIQDNFNIKYASEIPYGGMVDTVDSKSTA